MSSLAHESAATTNDPFQKSAASGMENVLERRHREREGWDAFWKVNLIEARGNPVKLIRHYFWSAFDFVPTWIREHVVEPLHDKYRWPYYHRQFPRVRSIDECAVGDEACRYEANWQFRLDRLVDTNILAILRDQMSECNEYYHQNWNRCLEAKDLFEENELNFFIKYGETAFMTDVVECYMKQKHRLIWERRHPRLVEARQTAFEEHKAKMAQGIYDDWFYNRSSLLSFKKHGTGVYRNSMQRNPSITRDDISQDPARLKEEQEMRKRGENPYPNDEYAPWEVAP